MAGPISINCHANETNQEETPHYFSCEEFEDEKYLLRKGSGCEVMSKDECGDYYGIFGEGYRLCAVNIEWNSTSDTKREVCKLTGAKSFPCQARAKEHKACEWFEAAYNKLGGGQECSHLDSHACRSYFDDYGDAYRMCDWMVSWNGTNLTSNSTNTSLSPDAVAATLTEGTCQLTGAVSYPCHYVTTTSTTTTNTYRLLPCDYFEQNRTFLGNYTCEDFTHEHCHQYYGVLSGQQYQGCVWRVTWDPVRNKRTQFCSMSADMSLHCPNAPYTPTVPDDMDRVDCDWFTHSQTYKAKLAEGQRCADVPSSEDCDRYYTTWGDGFRMCLWGYQWDEEAQKMDTFCSTTGIRSRPCDAAPFKFDAQPNQSANASLNGSSDQLNGTA
eukprot:gb/GFBE01067804.1/.p1 GENE.gb/GFBE01067804.1/~~gb/GFBE01067804.1/.p1  ORF type:complete len:384 (+),score=68.97 gb/GFBE01067804.1/:1-1152(+)